MSGPRILALLAVAALSAGGGYMAYRTWSGHDATEVSSARPLPGFALPDVEEQLRQSSEWDGRVRVINFWATWCPPCRREIPLLIDLQSRYGADIQVVGIAIDDLDAVQDYARTHPFNYPVLVGQQDAVDIGNKILADWIGLPFTAFVDATGHIIRVHVGELHDEQATEFLAEIL